MAEIQGRDGLDAPKWRRRRRLVAVTGLVIVGLFLFWLVLRGSSGW